MEANLSSSLRPDLFKENLKKIHRKLNVHLFDEISYNFQISTLVSKNLFHKIGILYTKLLYRIENINFSIQKNSSFLK